MSRGIKKEAAIEADRKFRAQPHLLWRACAADSGCWLVALIYVGRL